MSAVLHVLNGGVLATVQDRGRPNHQRWGVPASGAMDQFALHAANRLVRNARDAAALEITAGGALFEVLASTLLAVTGGDVGATLNDAPLPLWTAVFARAGSQLRFNGRTADWGARAYLAVAGGLDVPPRLGSRSTCLPGAFGGIDGRPLRAGDVLHAGATPLSLLVAGRRWPPNARPRYSATPTLRVLPGPHGDHFASDTLDLLQHAPFGLRASSNRMGYRLEGARFASHASDLASLPVFPGVVQVPPDGAPILLMADAQPTGGYPVLAVVVAPDLPLAAQLLPGDDVCFMLVSQDEAHAAWHETHHWLDAVLPEDEVAPILRWAGG